MRPHETPRGEEPDLTATIRDENMQLKIDVEVRKQLLNQAAGEINRQRNQIEKLLRENGGLQTQLLQIAAPDQKFSASLPLRAAAWSDEQETEVPNPQTNPGSASHSEV